MDHSVCELHVLPAYHHSLICPSPSHSGPRLRRRSLCRLPCLHRPPALCSQGAAKARWLVDEFGVSLSSQRRVLGAPMVATPPLVCVWPRVEDIRNSLWGWQSGGSVPGSDTSVHEACIRDRHRVWDATVSRRARAIPHMKSFLRYSVSRDGQLHVPWVYVGSCNLSKAAWGQLQNQQVHHTGCVRLCVQPHRGWCCRFVPLSQTHITPMRTHAHVPSPTPDPRPRTNAFNPYTVAFVCACLTGV
jgi:hypothetical protein